jgi:saccharopepsin
MPTNVADFLNTQIGAKRAPTGFYEVPCAKVDNLPEFSFYFGGKAYPLKGTEYIVEIRAACISPFIGLDTNFSGSGSQWVVGENLTNAVVHPSRCLNHKF